MFLVSMAYSAGGTYQRTMASGAPEIPEHLDMEKGDTFITLFNRKTTGLDGGRKRETT